MLRLRSGTWGSFPTQNPHLKDQKLAKIDAINVLLKTHIRDGRRESERGREVGRIAQATKHKTQGKGFLKNHWNKSPKCQNPPVWGTKEGERRRRTKPITQSAEYFKTKTKKLNKDQNFILNSAEKKKTPLPQTQSVR